jgi:glycosyltransferase involved in cell wall biosynthesis
MPKLSIITVNLNNKDGLIDTAQSVVAQTWIDYEWIIIDGGSTDGSVEIIKEYAGKTDKLVYWCSEPDGGIYQGMNKGIGKASGEYCWFLNSGDCAYKNTTLEEIFANEFDEDIVYGDIFVKHPSTIPAGIRRTNKVNVHSPVYWIEHPAIHHQGSFVKRDLFVKFGSYKTALRLASDAEFAMNAIFNNNATTKYINSVFVFYDNHGVSARSYFIYMQELKKIMKDMFQCLYILVYVQFICLRKPILMYNTFILRMQCFGIKKTTMYYINRLFHGRRNA